MGQVGRAPPPRARSASFVAADRPIRWLMLRTSKQTNERRTSQSIHPSVCQDHRAHPPARPSARALARAHTDPHQTRPTTHPLRSADSPSPRTDLPIHRIRTSRRAYVLCVACRDNQCTTGGTSQNIFMQQNCKSSCGMCPAIVIGRGGFIEGAIPATVQPTSECADSRPECGEWAAQGQCDPAAETFS